MHHMQIEKASYLVWRERLLAAHDDIDDVTLEDTLSGISDLPEMIAETLRSALEDEAIAESIKTRLETLRVRASRFQNRAQSKRAACLKIMRECEISSLRQPDLTASVRNSPPGVDIVDEAALPERFLIAQPAKIDRRAILTALKSDEAIPGAKLRDATFCLSVRV
ncbi:siphovirus Gp157 family protein [Hyphobacterium sp. HN65]|uniref:Siphovirus Gp157 family protein n=1 Tax=Hyphobacterium lacteum TaxID=3116575 RepID=A0ABU7LPK5_9PROT|nr:siphovirus Gp157 family protein [Hyphobacterium sp. HN65]MEE2525850.1 siphovirus Gp157 family protein [Hyphobacterium sp. HN65]